MAPRQAVLGMEQASFHHGAKPVFENLSFLLDGARTALVGENGAGKSTLLKCLAGELELDKGQVLKSRGLRVGSLPQDTPEAFADLTVREVLRLSLEKIGAAGARHCFRPSHTRYATPSHLTSAKPRLDAAISAPSASVASVVSMP